MGCYTYYVRDYFLNAGEYPLKGAHYQCLLQHCFRYCAYVAFAAPNSHTKAAEDIAKWQVENPGVAVSPETRRGCRALYHTGEELLQAMLNWTDDLFDPRTLSAHEYPEDPIFLRSDGSVFFDSILHEGECSLYPRDGEDISEVLSYGRWLFMNNQWKPEVPAAEHPFPFPSVNVIYQDPLFRELTAIRQQPEKFLPSPTIEELCKYIAGYRPAFLRNARNLPVGATFTPAWYAAFEMFVLGQCDAKTSEQIPSAMASKGCRAEKGFDYFYELLGQYLNKCKKSKQNG